MSRKNCGLSDREIVYQRVSIKFGIHPLTCAILLQPKLKLAQNYFINLLYIVGIASYLSKSTYLAPGRKGSKRVVCMVIFEIRNLFIARVSKCDTGSEGRMTRSRAAKIKAVNRRERQFSE